MPRGRRRPEDCIHPNTRRSGPGMSNRTRVATLSGTGRNNLGHRDDAAYPPNTLSFVPDGESSGGDMRRSSNLGRLTRYRRFESGFLQRRVCKLSVPERRTHRACTEHLLWIEGEREFTTFYR